ncbi:SIMPL domain-containing protein [Propionibacteriaceae bacterium G1746]|uniref:SIMPL domain-containing protein n=1 Tax=Aestuariimicrobium sp. G57 TaxID=3418485 RepID=UPI003C24F63F
MEISVRSRAIGRRQPDIAALYLRASHESPNREDAALRVHELMSSATQQLNTLKDTRPEVVDKLVISPVGVRTWRPWNKGKQMPPLYEASATIEVRLTDVEVVSELASGWSTIEGLNFGAPHWLLTDDSKAALEEEVTAEAVRLARRRAELMATASGFSSVVPIQVADSGLLSEGARPEAMFAMAAPAAARGSAGGAPMPEFEIKPEEITLDVSIEARFRAE